MKSHLQYWRNIDTFPSILRIIEFGYEIEFTSDPPPMHFSNNKSALNNSEFVSRTISDLLESACVIQVPFKPHVISPLSVADNKTKKRLILDLSCLNNYIQKEKRKFEDWKVA